MSDRLRELVIEANGRCRELLAEVESQAAVIERLRADCADLAADVIAYADNEWRYRDEYPHQQVKWERDTEVARRYVQTSLSGQEKADG